MIIKTIRSEWFQDYKLPSMFIAFPNCSFKCDKECGKNTCQNSHLSKLQNIKISVVSVIEKYIQNPITKAIVCGGLEPFDSFDDLWCFIFILRKAFCCDDPVVIYTGYTEQECIDSGWIGLLENFKNIIVKFGRYIPDQQTCFDDILGVRLASDNQYAVKIS